MEIILWIVVLVLTLGVEIATMGLTTIWFAGGALIALIAAAIGVPFVVQVVAFLVISVLLLIFTRPIAIKYFNKDRVRTNVESLVGRQAIVLSKVDNLHGVGQVSVGGQEWSAKSFDDAQILEEGSIVTIMAISGVKLICQAQKEQTAANVNQEQ